MTPETLTEELKAAMGGSLKSVLLYGSAAAGDHTGKRSDFNVLVVVERLAHADLKAMAPIAVRWQKAGNPPPLLFTLNRLQESSDVFPIELLDIRECHRVLHGDDLTETLEMSLTNLRTELEHELKGKLIQLREKYLLTEGRSKHVAALMVESLSTFLVLFRAALRLYQAEVPQPKLDALNALATHITFNTSVFETIHAMKEGQIKRRDVDTEALFTQYLETIEAVVDAVDSYMRTPRPAPGFLHNLFAAAKKVKEKEKEAAS